MDFWTSPSVMLAIAVGALILIAVLASRRRASSTIEAERERLATEAAPKCVCGEVASDPAPQLKRGRGAWDYLRSLYGAPPRYSREIDHMRPPVFCRAHVHVADAKLDEFIFNVRSDYSKLNADIAARAACFEQEHLLRHVADSLTEKQKRASRSTSVSPPLRMVQRTGTEDEGADR